MNPIPSHRGWFPLLRESSEAELTWWLASKCRKRRVTCILLLFHGLFFSTAARETLMAKHQTRCLPGMVACAVQLTFFPFSQGKGLQTWWRERTRVEPPNEKVMDGLQNDFVIISWGGRDTVSRTRELDPLSPEVPYRMMPWLVPVKVTVHIGSQLQQKWSVPRCKAPWSVLWPLQLQTPTLALVVGLPLLWWQAGGTYLAFELEHEMCLCHLQVNSGEKATGKCTWVGCKAYPCAKHLHCNWEMAQAAVILLEDLFPHRWSRHQLGIPGRQMPCDRSVAPAAEIVCYLSEQCLIWNVFPTDLTNYFPRQQQMAEVRWCSNFKASPEEGSEIISIYSLRIRKAWDLNICNSWK